MINSSKLFRIARKWQRKAAIRRRRISFPGNNGIVSNNDCSPVAEKGHVVVYTADQKRYSFPISYLNNHIFRELLRVAEEKFGLPSDGPITIPCEAPFMDYLISLIHSRATKDTENVLLLSISAYRCPSSCVVDQLESGHYSLVNCF